MRFFDGEKPVSLYLVTTGAAVAAEASRANGLMDNHEPTHRNLAIGAFKWHIERHHRIDGIPIVVEEVEEIPKGLFGAIFGGTSKGYVVEVLDDSMRL